jgi:hypothetical protein
MTKRMGRVICDITISAEGYVAGLNQTEERRSATTAAATGATSCTPGWPELPRGGSSAHLPSRRSRRGRRQSRPASACGAPLHMA